MKHRAFTLIEIVIALALMSVLMVFIVAALDVHLRQMSINRTEVEEAQLARAVLEKIARDIRSAVVALREEELEVDTETLSLMFGLYGIDETQYLADPTETASAMLEEETEVYGTIPGIYGETDWIQIDTALLPRGEMYGSRQVRSGSVLTDRLSPSKTVKYYLGDDTGQMLGADDPRYDPDNMVGSLGRSTDSTAVRYGLFRRQLDRMVWQYSNNEGADTEYEPYDEPLAPEVEDIEFAYFDPEAGQQGEVGDWVDYWDMDERQMLPLAVRITVFIRRQRPSRGLWGSSTTEELETVDYSLIVLLPVTIEPVESETETETATEE